jgi:hypothetical protein
MIARSVAYANATEHVAQVMNKFDTPMTLYEEHIATALRTHLLISINPTVGRNCPFPFPYSSISSQSRPVS